MNTNLKRAIAGLALMLSMGAASANTYNIGDLTSYGDFGYSKVYSTGTGNFSDIFNFSIPLLSESSASVAKAGVPSRYNINNLTLELYSGSNLLTPVNDVWFLSKGNYFFKVTGTATGSIGGGYDINASAAPVPEPSTWAMMLGGFGLIGFMSYRRRQYV